MANEDRLEEEEAQEELEDMEVIEVEDTSYDQLDEDIRHDFGLGEFDQSAQEHGVGCNCEDCWWAHDCKVVDDEGILND